MAGIGFELKKMFSEENSTFDDLKAVAYSTLIGVGPWFITVITLNILMYAGKKYIPLRVERNMVMITIVYGFIFSQLFAGMWQHFITRFISDCIYSGEQKKLRATYIGVIKLTMSICFIVSFIVVKDFDISLEFKISFIILLCFLCGIWISMNFINIVKNYLYAIFSYLVGNIVSIASGFYLLKYNKMEFFQKDISCSLVMAYTLGVAITFIMLYIYLNCIFEKNDENQFEFLKSFKRYYSLCFIGIVFNLGVWSHIFLNWKFGDAYKIKGIFITSPLYEVAVFYSFFLTIPTVVYFLVFMETKFFPVYKKYYALLTLNGTLSEINIEKKKMLQTLKDEIFYIMELQFFVSFSIALLSKTIFLKFSMDLYLLDLFRVMIFAAYCTVFVSVYLTIFLYFDARKEAVIISGIFFILNTLLTYIGFYFGESYTGVGFFIGSFTTLVLSEYLLSKIGEKLNYTTFYKQNFSLEIKAPFISRIANFLNKKLLFLAIVVLLLFTAGCSNYDSRGFNKKTGRNWHTMTYYDKQGYDKDGYDFQGINVRGFDKNGWNKFTNSKYDYMEFDAKGFNKRTGTKIDERGFDYKGYNHLTNSKYDKNGFDFQGINKDTQNEYNKDGWTWYGLNKYTQGYYDKNGFNMQGYDNQGYNLQGYDEKGYDRNGYNQDGYDEKGRKKPLNEVLDIEYDKDGYDKDGFDSDGVDRDGFDRNGVFVGD